MDLFYDIDDLDFSSFTDGNIPYSCLSIILSVLEQFKGNIDDNSELLKGNADKFHLITSSKTPVESKVSNIPVIGEENVKLFDI